MSIRVEGSGTLVAPSPFIVSVDVILSESEKKECPIVKESIAHLSAVLGDNEPLKRATGWSFERITSMGRSDDK